MNKSMRQWLATLLCIYVVFFPNLHAKNKPSSLSNEIGAVVKEIQNPGQIDKVELKVQLWQRKADKYKKQKKYDEAIKCLQSAINVAKPLWGENNVIEASMRMQMVTLYMNKKEYYKAVALMRQVLKSYRSSTAHILKPTLYFKLRLTLIGILFNLEEYVAAQKEIDIVTQSVPRLIELKSKECLIKYYYWQAKLQAVDDKPAEVIKYAKKCIALIGSEYSEANKVFLTQSYCLLCNALKNLNRTKEQHPYLTKCMEICRNNYSHDKAIMGFQYYNIGMYYYDKDDYEQALTSFNNAVIAFRLVADSEPIGLGLSLLLKGKCLAEMKKWKAALEYFKKSIDQFQKIAKKDRTPYIYECLYDAYRWLFRCCMETKEYSLGINSFKSIEKKLLKKPKTENTIGLYLGVAGLYLDSQNYNSAQKYCHLALSTSSNLKIDKKIDLTINRIKWILALAYYRDRKITQAILYGEQVLNSGHAPQLKQRIDKWKKESAKALSK
jgi:tetratricopeptide (TPR) repeat protein